MEFLAPWFGALAAAAAVPLLLHLLRRRVGNRVDFPAVRYLLRAEQEQSARLRLRNWLLMALRVLAVLLVAFAAARPVARTGAGGHVPGAVAIVLDNSLSTTAVVGGRPLVDALHDVARGVVGAASPEDRLWLVTADGHVTGGDRATLRDAVTALPPLGGAGDLPRAVARAAEVVRAAGRPAATVVVLTDAQSSAWRTVPDLRGVRVVVHVPAGAPPRNRAVVVAEARPPRWTPAGAVVARVQSADSAPYRVTELDAGGPRTLARGTAAPDAELMARVQPTARGWLGGSVAVEPDELRGDDERFFAVFAGPPPSAVADPTAGPFVASALATLAQSGRVAPGAPSALIGSADAVSRLPALLTAPQEPARLGPANLALERLGVPWRFAAARTGEAPVRLDGPGGDSARVGITASRRYQLVARGSSQADTVATAGGEPWVVAGPGYVLVASPLVPEATTLPVRAAFVPWLGELLTTRLSGAPGAITAAAPGASVTAPPGTEALVGTDGRRLPVAAGPTPAPARPGVYFWLRGGARVGALVVNPEAEESQLARLGARVLADRLGGRSAQVAVSSDEAERAAYGAPGRRPVGTPLLLAALLALAAEGLVTRRARAPAAGAMARAA